MAKTSLEELRGRVAAGEYAIDSGALAGVILVDFALVRRVRRLLVGAGDERGEEDGGTSSRRRRRLREGPVRPLLPRRERLQ